jgi:hypothetical protein
MTKPAKSRAEELHIAAKKQEKQFLEDKEEARCERTEGISKLRELRMAKELADKKAALKAGPKPKRVRAK